VHKQPSSDIAVTVYWIIYDIGSDSHTVGNDQHGISRVTSYIL